MYTYNVLTWARQLSGWLVASFGRFDPRFRKRLEWITQCASVAMFYLYQFDNLKSNTSTYFIKVLNIWVPKQFPWGFGMVTIPVEAGGCYYLGFFPNYWSFDYHYIVYAHNLPRGMIAQMGSAPKMYDMEAVAKSGEFFERTGIYGQPIEQYIPSTIEKEIKDLAEKYGKESMNNYFNPYFIGKDFTQEQKDQIKLTNKAIEDDLLHIGTFIKPNELAPYVQQYFDLGERTNDYKHCKESKYAKPTKKPRFQEPPQDGPQSPITPPSPDGAPAGRTGPGAIPPDKDILNVSINYGEKHGTPYPTLNMQIWLYWI